MKIALVTTQSLTGSTIIGRVLPLAEELAKKHGVHVLVHRGPSSLQPATYSLHPIGRDPFERTFSGKQRQRGFALALTILTNAVIASVKLIFLKPDAIIIVKSLPENVLAAWLYKKLARRSFSGGRVILDVDDFELTANVTTSWTQRAAIHWAERTGAQLAHHIVAATPFLSDHFEQLTRGKKPITMIPTGLTLNLLYTPDVYTLVHIGSEKSVLVYAGSLSLTSGHRIDLLPDILAEVRKQIPEIQLHIFGTGDDEEKLKNMFNENNLDEAVTWHDRFNVEELPNQIPSNAILLDPVDGSITNRAKSSFRVALATSLGLPVVTSNIGIRPYLIPDILHERCFAKPGDAGDYAKKIVALLKDQLTVAQRNLLKEHSKQFTWQTLASEYEKIIAA